jgi:hypothetical protein
VVACSVVGGTTPPCLSRKPVEHLGGALVAPPATGVVLGAREGPRRNREEADGLERGGSAREGEGDEYDSLAEAGAQGREAEGWSHDEERGVDERRDLHLRRRYLGGIWEPSPSCKSASANARVAVM